MRDAVIELVETLRTSQDAGEHFDSKLARQALDELIELVIQVCVKISEHFSRSKAGKPG